MKIYSLLCQYKEEQREKEGVKKVCTLLPCLLSSRVVESGEMSNFLVEDLAKVLEFIKGAE